MFHFRTYPGRNIVLAVAASVDEKEALLVYPLMFPELLGRAVSLGIRNSPPPFAKNKERLRLEEADIDRKISERAFRDRA